MTTQRRQRAEQARTVYRGALCAWLSVMCVVGCGGEDVDAPYAASSDQCPDLEDHLAPLVTLAEADALPTLRAVMSEDLSDDERDDLVVLILDLVGALEPGAVSELAGADLGVGQLDDAEETLATLCRWIAAEGPGAPYSATLAFAVTAINSDQCEGPLLFFLVQEVLAEEALLRSVLAAIMDPQLDVQELLDGLDSTEEDPVSGLRALVRNLLTAATKEGFDVQDWTNYLALVPSLDVDAPPWSDLIAGLEAFLVPGPRLDAMRSVVACVLAVDPDLAWVEPIYDLLTSPPDLAISLEDVADVDTMGPLIPTALRGPLESAILLLREDESARQTLVRTLTKLLDAERAPGVLLDLAVLFEARVLVGVVEGLVAVATRGCAP